MDRGRQVQKIIKSSVLEENSQAKSYVLPKAEEVEKKMWDSMWGP